MLFRWAPPRSPLRQSCPARTRRGREGRAPHGLRRRTCLVRVRSEARSVAQRRSASHVRSAESLLGRAGWSCGPRAKGLATCGRKPAPVHRTMAPGAHAHRPGNLAFINTRLARAENVTLRRQDVIDDLQYRSGSAPRSRGSRSRRCERLAPTCGSSHARHRRKRGSRFRRSSRVVRSGHRSTACVHRGKDARHHLKTTPLLKVTPRS